MFKKQELIEKLINLEMYMDEILEQGSSVALLIVGGASLIISELTSRPTTSDIDVFVSDPDNWQLNSFENIFGDEIAEEIMDKFDINSHVYFFKLPKIISEMNMSFIKLDNEWSKRFKYIKLYTLNIEGLVLTKLLVMMEEDQKRNDRDYIDIKDLVDQVNHTLLNEYIEVWKNKFARKLELEKFDKAYNRWLGK